MTKIEDEHFSLFEDEKENEEASSKAADVQNCVDSEFEGKVELWKSSVTERAGLFDEDLLDRPVLDTTIQDSTNKPTLDTSTQVSPERESNAPKIVKFWDAAESKPFTTDSIEDLIAIEPEVLQKIIFRHDATRNESAIHPSILSDDPEAMSESKRRRVVEEPLSVEVLSSGLKSSHVNPCESSNIKDDTVKNNSEIKHVVCDLGVSKVENNSRISVPASNSETMSAEPKTRNFKNELKSENNAQPSENSEASKNTEKNSNSAGVFASLNLTQCLTQEQQLEAMGDVIKYLEERIRILTAQNENFRAVIEKKDGEITALKSQATYFGHPRTSVNSNRVRLAVAKGLAILGRLKDGKGKTIVSGRDYNRLLKKNGQLKLLIDKLIEKLLNMKKKK